MTHNETDRLPWCTDCEAIAVPTDDGECGDCGSSITFREEPT